MGAGDIGQSVCMGSRTHTGFVGEQAALCALRNSDLKSSTDAAADDGLGSKCILEDQTYFIYRVPSEILAKVRFPLATMNKNDVIKLAKEAKLRAADREESQDFAC